jgi:outer membrane protein OmpA-like peptidoglycan-associated protein
MKTIGLITGALVLSLLGTGCVATHKYVAKTIAPVEQRVSGTESKNGDQDKQLAAHDTHLTEIDRDASQTKEKLGDTDAKAVRAGAAASVADQKAVSAQQSADIAKQSADGAKQAADGAHTFAEQGLNKMGQTVEAMNKFQMLKSETILFGFNQAKLTPDATAQLDGVSKDVRGHDRYVIEVQGFTDKTGAPDYNESLSEQRAQTVARYLANQYDIPVRSITILGSGYAKPVADDKTRDGRKMNRRVEVRLWIPESEGNKTVASGAGGQ